MVRFIRQEAEEKANEISVSAEEEFNIEKLQLVEAEKKKIRQEYERKEKQVEIRKKIEYSMQLNASRIKVLQAQDDVVNSMKEAAGKELLKAGGDHHVYKKLLKDLIVQGNTQDPVRFISLSPKSIRTAEELPRCARSIELLSLPSLRIVHLSPAAKMNDADVSKQIQQMVRFIRQEAEEKANEISVSAEEEFNIEKLQLVEAEKKKIRQEYERKEKQVEIRKKIEYSMQLNASRIKVLQAQDDVVNSMKEAAGKELLKAGGDHHVYKKLLKDLIVQSLLRLKEPAALLRCRKDDVHLVESVLDSAGEEYAQKANVHPPVIEIDHRVYLPPPPSHKNTSGLFCSGGVVLASRDGKIVCENTLDARLDVVFRKKLPEIRKWLFGQVAA
ncbi:hypothetical protein SAY87_000373 [Trapa incisa]|uniref:V-type proton ATPase subunit E n=2 Tax=malvids TaxID=91836 RepID=A0AAN7JGK2_9MYRT|nr:hypothetical protein SAY87_000373 [Trapa incisa]